MHEGWVHQLETWHEFYLLIGTAGLTLTGLLFVIVSLGPHVVADHQGTGVRAFVSPNAVYFSFVGLPIVSYVLLLLSGVGFLFQVALSMHGVAGALILLLVIGIRNAWDLVIWIAQQERK